MYEAANIHLDIYKNLRSKKTFDDAATIFSKVLEVIEQQRQLMPVIVML